LTSSIIKLLDDNSINMIAAGEVIDRPSSVVKELVENSLDAGAKRVEIEIESGGIGKIRVIDDGWGMSEQDVRMAVLRHATSKLNNAGELFSVTSMGFRGEALPSIASVSKFSLISRQAANSLGTRLEIIGGQLLDVTECGADIGTVIVVKDLFFNTPARLKFMKTAASESSHIHEALVKLSLSRPDVTFRLTNNGRTTMQTPGSGRLSDTLAALYGPETFSQLFSIDYCENEIKIGGFAARPSVRKRNRQWQSFTINRRVIGSRLLNRAVDTAYQSLLPSGSHPLVILQITMPSQWVDVNVHPQKSEVKFQDEKSVFRAVHAALKQTLFAPENPVKLSASFDHTLYRPSCQTVYVQESLPVRLEIAEHLYGQNINHQDYAPGNDQQNYSISIHTMIPDQPPKNFHGVDQAILEHPLSHNISKNINEKSLLQLKEPPIFLQAIAQFKQCYILAADGEYLYIVDQHAAHERILFDSLSRQQRSDAFQTLLIPLLLELDPFEVQVAEAHESDLAVLGFVFDWISPSTVRLSELPTRIPPQEAAVLFREILSTVLTYKLPDMESLRKAWIDTAACHMAVRAGQSLNQQQMQGLLDDLLKTERPYACPHGRPTLIRFSDQDMARLFKRI